MKGRFLFISVVAFILLAGKAYAMQAPAFPSCTNPHGRILASYADGTHGIPGDITSHTGSDAVFQISSTQDLQCFCNGTNGIQTNWWKVDGMSFVEITQWEKQGWVYIPDGSLWGLDPEAYLAQNSNFTCQNSTGAGNTTTLGVNDPGIQGVLGAMASTGFFTDHVFATLGSLGIALMIIAFLLSKKYTKFFHLFSLFFF